ncbi:MAG: ankyrin repeat domain-containing protein [Rhodothermales bacterium]|nr:ankyrin repeat domain-containing protein [Rhodothermales bacterium]
MQLRSVFIVTLLLIWPFLAGCESQTRPTAIGLHEAALTGNVEAVQHHLAAGSDLNARDEYGSTPLIVASTFGRTEVARALIVAGADLQAGNSDGSSPLHIASFLCYPEIVAVLLEHGADPNATNANGTTPLQGVMGPFDAVKGIYDAIGGALSPLGLQLDYDRIRATRPVVADMLRAAEEESRRNDGEPTIDETAQG